MNPKPLRKKIFARSRAPLSGLGLVLVLAAMTSLSGCRCQRQADSATPQDLIAASRTLEGEPVTLSSTKFIIVNFWASWCGPCIQETPSLLRLARENPASITLVAISEDESLKELKNFLRLYPMTKAPNIFLVHDLDRRLSLGFGVRKFPESFVFDHNFRLVKKVDGAIDWGQAWPDISASR